MTQSGSDSRSFPRRSAATRNFRLGAPRTFTISPDGERVVFLRSAAGDDPVNRLWVLDVATGDERCVVQPAGLLGADDPADLPAEERARRERARESQSGIVAYATDADVTMAAFALNGRLFHVSLVTERGAVEIEAPGGVNDPRPDPTGSTIAFVANGALHLASVADGTVSQLVGPHDDEDTVTWGLPDFVAAEEMGRFRGYWWSPSGDALLVARVDEGPVATWFIADPEHPQAEPQARRYPAAGTNNADVSLWRIDMDLALTEVAWDHEQYPYLADVSWSNGVDPLVTVQSRDQRDVITLTVNDDATTSVVHEQHDDVWVELVPGSPARLSDGRVLAVVDDADVDTRRLTVDGAPLTLPGFQVRAVVDVDDDSAVVIGGNEPTECDVVSINLSDGTMTAISAVGGWHSARRKGGTTVLASQSISDTDTTVEVESAAGTTTIESFAESPSVTPHPTLLNAGATAIRTAVLFPTGHEPGSRRLPVLMDPYGGPHAQRVLAAGAAFTTAQWWADQGFAVVIADGRGTPGRGPAFERSVHHDLADGVLADQVEALEAAAERFPNDLDLDRVAIRGWSFGGYLAALAVLKRPESFHAAIAGAPVTDWALYDTHYTERYLGSPNDVPEVYEANSLIPLAPQLTRPLMLIHGLADDNVVAAHTLRLSSALLAAGRPHTVLPLSGVTHMTPQEVVAENLLLLQVAFIKDALGIDK